MRCAQCNEVNAWTMAHCRSCGAPLAASAGASAGAGVRGEGPPAPHGTPGAREAGQRPPA